MSAAVHSVKIIRYDGIREEVEARALVLDSRGAEHELRVQVLNPCSEDVITGIAGKIHEIEFNDRALPEGAPDDELGYVFSAFDPGSSMYVPVEGESFFLTDADFDAVTLRIETLVEERIADARDAAEIAFTDVLLGREITS